MFIKWKRIGERVDIIEGEIWKDDYGSKYIVLEMFFYILFTLC